MTAVDAAKSARRNRSPVGPSKSRLWRVLGPGLITGASDDDPSGIATYSQAGAKFGFAITWTMLFTYPLMCVIQEISARIPSLNWKQVPELSITEASAAASSSRCRVHQSPTARHTNAPWPPHWNSLHVPRVFLMGEAMEPDSGKAGFPTGCALPA
jgi:hypothetical protein